MKARGAHEWDASKPHPSMAARDQREGKGGERESLVEWNTAKCGVTNFEFITKITLCSFLLKMKMLKSCFHILYSNPHFLDSENEYWIQICIPNLFFLFLWIPQKIENEYTKHHFFLLIKHLLSVQFEVKDKTRFLSFTTLLEWALSKGQASL